ncbi:hypothetical protein EB796_012067 [Bugula neritina]|uniref:Uncharacterized protein n=1 Tax=Bugula neritina TaxID=10212 RepID=A0A7J7JWB1_BUGNE|nr:hypothetical protein EB796_012067 [Bugula neritina]
METLDPAQPGGNFFLKYQYLQNYLEYLSKLNCNKILREPRLKAGIKLVLSPHLSPNHNDFVLITISIIETFAWIKALCLSITFGIAIRLITKDGISNLTATTLFLSATTLAATKTCFLCFLFLSIYLSFWLHLFACINIFRCRMLVEIAGDSHISRQIKSIVDMRH